MPKLYKKCVTNCRLSDCTFCGKSFSSSHTGRNSIVKHLKRAHPEKCYKCNKCNEYFITWTDKIHKNHVKNKIHNNQISDEEIDQISDEPSFDVEIMNPFKYVNF